MVVMKFFFAKWLIDKIMLSIICHQGLCQRFLSLQISDASWTRVEAKFRPCRMRLHSRDKGYTTHCLLSCTSFEKRFYWIYNLLVCNVHLSHLSSYPKISLSPFTLSNDFLAILLLGSFFFLARISAVIFYKWFTYSFKLISSSL